MPIERYINTEYAGTNTTVLPFGTEVVGDTNFRFSLTSEGDLTWGTGTAPGDTTLSRLAGGGLTIGPSLTVAGPTTLNGNASISGSLTAGNTTVGGTLSASGATSLANTTITGALSVSGAVSVGSVTPPLTITAAAAATTTWQTKVTGDTQQRFIMTAGGNLSWGPGGSTAPNAQIYTDASGLLYYRGPTGNIGGLDIQRGYAVLRGQAATYATLQFTALDSTTMAGYIANDGGVFYLQGNAANSQRFMVASNNTGGSLVEHHAPASVPFTIQAAPSQSADTFDIKNSAGTKLSWFDSTGQYNQPADTALTVGHLQLGDSTTYGWGSISTTDNRRLVISNVNAVQIYNPVSIFNATAGSNALLVQGAASQTGDLLQIQNNSSNILAGFGSNGRLYLNNTVASTVPFTINLAASQSGDAFQVYNSTPSKMTWIDSAGAIWGGALNIKSNGILSLWPYNNQAIQIMYLNNWVDTQAGLSFYLADKIQFFGNLGVPIGRVGWSTAGFAIFAGTYSLANEPVPVGVLDVIGGPSYNKIMLRIVGSSAQTTDLTQWQNSSNTVLGGINATGQQYLGAVGSFGGGVGPMIFLGNDGTDPGGAVSGGSVLFSNGTTALTVKAPADSRFWMKRGATGDSAVWLGGDGNNGDSIINLFRGGGQNEDMRLAAAAGGSTGQNNVYLIDRISGSVATGRDLLYRYASDGGTTYTNQLRLQGANAGGTIIAYQPASADIVQYQNSAGSANLAGITNLGGRYGPTLVLTNLVAATVPLTINLAASQSGHAFDIKDSGGNSRLYLDSNWVLGGGDPTYGALILNGYGGGGVYMQTSGTMTGRVYNGTGWSDSVTGAHLELGAAGGYAQVEAVFGAALARFGIASAGTTIYDGGSYSSITPPTALVDVVLNTASKVGLNITGAASPSADLFRIRNNAGQIMYGVNSAGTFYASAQPMNIQAGTDIQMWSRSNQVMYFNGSIATWSDSVTGSRLDLGAGSGLVLDAQSGGSIPRLGIITNGMIITSGVAPTTITPPAALLDVVSGGNVVTLRAKMTAGQTVDAFDIVNSAGTAITKVGSAGTLSIPSVAAQSAPMLTLGDPAGLGNGGINFYSYNGVLTQMYPGQNLAGANASGYFTLQTAAGQAFVINSPLTYLSSGNLQINPAASGPAIYVNGNNAVQFNAAGQGQAFNWSNGQLLLTAASATTVPFAIKAATSQTADLQQWYNSGNQNVVRVTAAGDIGYVIANYLSFVDNNAANLMRLQTWPAGAWTDNQTATLVSLGTAASGYAWINGTGGTNLTRLGLNVGVVHITTAQYPSAAPPTAGYRLQVDGNILAQSETIIPPAATTIPLTLQGAASQSADLFDIKNSAAAVLAGFDSTGRPFVGATPSWGGGTGPMMFVGNDTADPSTNPTSGTILFSSAGVLKARTPDGTVTQIAPAALRLSTVKVTATGANSVTVPSWATVADVILVGGGGGGGGGGAAALTGGVTTQTGGAGGGAGGDLHVVVTVVPNDTLTVTIGAGGTAGTGGAASSGSTGNAGNLGGGGGNSSITGSGVNYSVSGAGPGRAGGANTTTASNAGVKGTNANGANATILYGQGTGSISGAVPIAGGPGPYSAGGGAGGVIANATNGGVGGAPGTFVGQTQVGQAQTGTATGGNSVDAAPNTGAGGGGGGGGAPGGAGGNGGAGGSGFAVITFRSI